MLPSGHRKSLAAEQGLDPLRSRFYSQMEGLPSPTPGPSKDNKTNIRDLAFHILQSNLTVEVFLLAILIDTIHGNDGEQSARDGTGRC